MKKIVIFAALLVAAQQVFAQSPALSPKNSAPPPHNAPAVSAAAKYRSTFTDYRPYQDPQPDSWRELNERARVLGGHRGQMRPEAPAASAPAPAPVTNAASPAPHGH